MTDSEFIRSYSEIVFSYYDKAKKFQFIDPKGSLVSIRHILEEICHKILEENNFKGRLTNLYSRINKLYKLDYIDKDTMDLLHQIRQKTNKGAHLQNDEENISDEEYISICNTGIKDICSLVELLKNEKVEYTFIPSAETEDKRALSYAAIFESDKVAQYKIGHLFNKEAGKLWDSAQDALEKREQNFDYNESKASFIYLKDKAYFWFDQVKEEFEDAKYECALKLYTDETILNKTTALTYLEDLVKQEHISSIFLLARYYFEQENHAKAIELIELARTCGNTLAYNLLAHYYLTGQKPIKRNIKKAVDYFIIAAEEDHPDAQYQLYMLGLSNKTSGLSREKLMSFLTASAEQKYVPAMCELAGLHVKSNKKHEARKLYDKVIMQPDISNKSLVKYGKFKLKHYEKIEDLQKAFFMLLNTYNEDDGISVEFDDIIDKIYKKLRHEKLNELSYEELCSQFPSKKEFFNYVRNFLQ